MDIFCSNYIYILLCNEHVFILLSLVQAHFLKQSTWLTILTLHRSWWTTDRIFQLLIRDQNLYLSARYSN